LQLNSSYLSGQKAADNVGMYGVIDVDSASVKWRVTGDFSQHALWTDNLSLRPDLLDGGGETFPLGRAEGSPAILIGKSWVKYGD
jgi:hypothetical protein